MVLRYSFWSHLLALSHCHCHRLFRISKLTFYSDLRRRAASRLALPCPSSWLLLCRWVAARHRRTARRPSQSLVAAAFSGCRQRPRSVKPVDDLGAQVDHPASGCHRPAPMQEERDPRRPAAATDAASAGDASATGRCRISL